MSLYREVNRLRILPIIQFPALSCQTSLIEGEERKSSSSLPVEKNEIAARC